MFNLIFRDVLDHEVTEEEFIESAVDYVYAYMIDRQENFDEWAICYVMSRTDTAYLTDRDSEYEEGEKPKQYVRIFMTNYDVAMMDDDIAPLPSWGTNGEFMTFCEVVTSGDDGHDYDLVTIEPDNPWQRAFIKEQIRSAIRETRQKLEIAENDPELLDKLK